MSPEGLTDFVVKYWHKRTSKAGLFVGLALLSVVLFLASRLAHPVFKEAGVISNDIEGSQLYDTICLMVWIVCEIIYLVAWLFWRQIIIPHDDAILVIFAPWAEDDHRDVVRRLYTQFNMELASRGLGKQIHAILLPPEEIILNHDNANRLMYKRNARLVIFGRVGKGSLKGKKAEGFSEISFTIRHVIPPEDAQLLASSFSIEDFQILDENSLVDSNFASENLSNCACVFIGISLTAERKYELAREVWQNVFDQCKSNAANQISAKHIKFSQIVSRWFQWNEFCWVVDYYRVNVVDKITSRSVDQHAIICQNRLMF